MTRAELFSTAETPYQGLKSDRHPLTLGPGEAFDAQNLRCEPGQPITVRDGIAPLLDTTGLPAMSEFYGAAEPFDADNSWQYLIALRDPSDDKIHIYSRYYDKQLQAWSTENWIEVTSIGGRYHRYGDTRLVVPERGYIEFEQVRAPYDDTPRIVLHDGSQTATVHRGDFNEAVRANAITPPSELRAFPVVSRMMDGLDVANGAVTLSTPAGDWTTVARSGSAGSYYWEFVTAATVAGGSAASIYHNADDADVTLPGPSGYAKQLVMIAEYSDRAVWDTVKVEVRMNLDGSTDTWYTIHDPVGSLPATPGLSSMIEIGTNVSGYKVLAFALQDRTADITVGGGVATFDGIRITTDASTPANATIKLHWMASSGRVPGGTEYGCCRRQTDSLVDSPGVIYQVSGFGEDVPSSRQQSGGLYNKTAESDFNSRSQGFLSDGASVPGEFIFPVDPRIFYVYDVPSSLPEYEDFLTHYATNFVIYRKEPGEFEFYRVYDSELVTFDTNAGFWVHSSGSQAVILFSDYVLSEERDFRDRLPDEFTKPPPGGTALAFANNRLYAAASLSDGTGNKLMISEQGQPLRFRELVRMDTPSLADPASGFATKIEGEAIRAIRAVSEGVQAPNGSAVLLFTDKNVYSVDRNVGGGAALFQLRKINSLGCSSGASVSESDGNVLWLDKDRVVRSLDGSPLSLTNVDKKLQAVPAALLSRTSGMFHRGRYYLSYPTASATANDRVLVYSLVGGYWESDDVLPTGKSVQGWFEWWQEGDRRLAFFTEGGHIYRYESPGQPTDDGDAIAFALESGEFHNRMFEPVLAQHLGIVGTSVTTTLWTDRIFSEPSATVQGELDLDTGTTLAWKYDRRIGGGTPGGEGQSVRFRIRGDFTQPFELLALVAEVEGAELGGASG